MPVILLLLFFISFLLPLPAGATAANVTFDDQGTWIVNGQRLFLYSTHEPPRSPGVSPFSSAVWESIVDHYHLTAVTAGESVKYDDLARERGIFLLSGQPRLKYPDDNPLTPEPNDGWNNPTAKAAYTEQISRGRRILFMATSENVLTSDRVFPGYDYLAADFPNIPAHINFTQMGLRYSPQMKDYLTRTKANVISSHQGDPVAAASVMSKLRDELPTLKSTFLLLRGYEGENPRLEEDIFRAIIKGINGIYFWDPTKAATGGQFQGWFGDIIAKVGGYLYEIQPGLVAPNRIYKSDYMMSKGADNRYYIVAYTTGQLSVTGLPANTEFERLFYGTGTVTTNDSGTLSDNFSSKVKIYRQKTASNVSGDLTGDGHVNLADYNKLVSQYGTVYNLSHYNQLLANYGK